MSEFLLLRHDGGAGGIGVRELDEAELPAGPEDELLGQTREVGHDERERGAELYAEVPVRDGVKAVVADPVEAELRGGHLAVDGVGGTSEAQAPRGETFMRFTASPSRPRSRASIMP